MRTFLPIILLYLITPCVNAALQELVVTIQAENPSPVRVQEATIRRGLPPLVTPAQVIDTAGLEISYDAPDALYVLHGVVRLDPREVRALRVRIRNEWLLKSSSIYDLQFHAQKLLTLLRNSRHEMEARFITAETRASLERVLENQSRYRADPQDAGAFFRGYAQTLKYRADALRAIGRLEDLVLLNQHGDPGRILGLSVRPAPRAIGHGTPSPGQAAVRFSFEIHNPSQELTQTSSLKRELPQEIEPHDVLNADGLRVGYDNERKMTYVYSRDILLPPGATRVYAVSVRNRWVINRPEIAALQRDAAIRLAQLERRVQWPAVQTELRDIMRGLDHLAATKHPFSVDTAWIASYRARDRDLAKLEARYARLESLFRADVPGMGVLVPDVRTTWLIIYTILGFVAVVAAASYVRWHRAALRARGDHWKSVY